MLPAAAARAYTALHRGRAPEAREVSVQSPRWLVEVGKAHAVEYFKEVPGGVEYRRHEFRPDAAPLLAHDERGQLHFAGGRYRTTDRGIVDAEEGDKMNKVPLANPDVGDAMEKALTIGTAGAAGVGVHVLGQQVPGTEPVKIGAQAGVAALGAFALYLAGASPRVVDAALAGGSAAVAIRGADALAVNGYVSQWVERLKNAAQTTPQGQNAPQMGAGQQGQTGGSQGLYHYGRAY